MWGEPLPNGVSDRSTARITEVSKATATADTSVVAGREVEMDVDVEAEATLFAASIPLIRNASCSAPVDDELSILSKCSCGVGRISGFDHDVSPCDGKTIPMHVSARSWWMRWSEQSRRLRV